MPLAGPRGATAQGARATATEIGANRQGLRCARGRATCLPAARSAHHHLGKIAHAGAPSSPSEPGPPEESRIAAGSARWSPHALERCRPAGGRRGTVLVSVPGARHSVAGARQTIDNWCRAWGREILGEFWPRHCRSCLGGAPAGSRVLSNDPRQVCRRTVRGRHRTPRSRRGCPRVNRVAEVARLVQESPCACRPSDRFP